MVYNSGNAVIMGQVVDGLPLPLDIGLIGPTASISIGHGAYRMPFPIID